MTQVAKPLSDPILGHELGTLFSLARRPVPHVPISLTHPSLPRLCSQQDPRPRLSRPSWSRCFRSILLGGAIRATPRSRLWSSRSMKMKMNRFDFTGRRNRTFVGWRRVEARWGRINFLPPKINLASITLKNARILNFPLQLPISFLVQMETENTAEF